MLARNCLLAGVVGAVALQGTGAAFASPGEATAALNVRSGPGVGYAVVDTLQPGESVDIGQCQAGWCYVTYNGPAGWAAATYLSGAGAEYSGPVYEPAPVYAPPPVYFDQGFGSGFNPGYHPHFQHQHRFPGTGTPSKWTGSHPGFTPHPGFMPHMRPPHVTGSGGGNFCAINPTVCQAHHHNKPISTPAVRSVARQSAGRVTKIPAPRLRPIVASCCVAHREPATPRRYGKRTHGQVRCHRFFSRRAAGPDARDGRQPPPRPAPPIR